MNYLSKDITKFAPCNKLIARGVAGSSSHSYSVGNGLHIPNDNINTTHYNSEDIVGVSVDGNRRGRVRFDDKLLAKALMAKATIITDNNYHRNIPFNVGEREVARLLLKYGYRCTDGYYRGVWQYNIDCELELHRSITFYQKFS